MASMAVCYGQPVTVFFSRHPSDPTNHKPQPITNHTPSDLANDVISLRSSRPSVRALASEPSPSQVLRLSMNTDCEDHTYAGHAILKTSSLSVSGYSSVIAQLQMEQTLTMSKVLERLKGDHSVKALLFREQIELLQRPAQGHIAHYTSSLGRRAKSSSKCEVLFPFFYNYCLAITSRSSSPYTRSTATCKPCCSLSVTFDLSVGCNEALADPLAARQCLRHQVCGRLRDPIGVDRNGAVRLRLLIIGR